MTDELSKEQLAKQSELRYRRLFETAQDGILILDFQTGVIQDANPFITNLLGFTRDELIGKELWEIGAMVDKAAALSAFTVPSSTGTNEPDEICVPVPPEVLSIGLSTPR